MIRIAIADDHPIVIKGLQQMLASYPHIVITHTYPDGESLMAGMVHDVPDVLLLDIQMPGLTGEDVVPQIKKKYPAVKILMLTNFDSTLYVNNMLRHGADGYMLKTSDEDRMIEAIETVYKNEEYIEPSLLEKMQQHQSRVKKELRSNAAITPREKEILQLIVNGHTSNEIAERLHISFRTVENYRLNILLKLDVKNTAMLVKKALKLGLAD